MMTRIVSSLRTYPKIGFFGIYLQSERLSVTGCERMSDWLFRRLVDAGYTPLIGRLIG